MTPALRSTLVRTCALISLSLTSCSEESKVPGIDLGAPELSWNVKNTEQRFGFMAARVHPGMQAVFTKYDDGYADDFECEICHGEQPELVDYAMPSEDVYALPAEDPIGVTMEDDPDIGNFMMGDVVPALQGMFNQGQGGATKVTCFSCHPKED